MTFIVLSKINQVGIILISIGGAILFGLGFYLLYHFVFSRNAIRRQIKDLERKYSYLDALLIGQDSQYIHRLEIISRTNLLYVERYNEFSRKFKEVFEGEDKFAESMIKQAKALVANNQFQKIKEVISDTKKAIASFEQKVNQLDKDLYEVIKPEEEARHLVLRLKEDYRRVKQIFYANSSDLELVTSSFTHVFDKLDTSFSEFENHIESAEYEEANALIPVIGKVIRALDSALSQLPNLCILSQLIIPDKIAALTKEYSDVESSGIPLFNISFKHRVDVWNMTLESNRKKLIALQTIGVMESFDKIQQEIEETHNLLNDETQDKDDFIKSCDALYAKVVDLEKTFLKICSLLPEVNNIYVISDEQKENIDQLKDSMNKLGTSKRTLDNFIHSSTKQPFSILKKKLDELDDDYNKANGQVHDFKAYLDSLKETSEEAYTMVFAYYYHCKQVESLLRNLDIPDFASSYKEQIETCYTLLNEIDMALKVKPIDVETINEKVASLKTEANAFFDDAENKCREAQLAESAIVYANRDRHHQKDVHQQLNVLEKSFYDGEFLKVYHDASAIYRRMHVEEETNAKK